MLANDKVVEGATGAPVGFAGPVGLRIPIYCDLEVCALASFVCGANAADAHYKNVVSKRDFAPTLCGDFRDAAVGDLVPAARRDISPAIAASRSAKFSFLAPSIPRP